MRTLAVLVTDVEQEKNRHLIGEIFEVSAIITTDVDGIPSLFSMEGEYSFEQEQLFFTPSYYLDLNRVEILEVFEEDE